MGTNIQYSAWDANVSLSNNWTSVWSTPTLTTSALFHEAVFQVNSNTIDTRITINGVIVFDFTLQELAGDFGLSFTGPDVRGFSIYEFENNKWILKPPSAWRIDANDFMQIEMKKSSGSNKALVRGLSVWGAP